MNDYKKVIADKWTYRAPKFDTDHATENLDEWRKMLEELIGLKGKGKVLDVGTGTGFLANMIAELGYESIGIDFSEGMLEIGRENTKARGVSVEYFMGDGDELPFEDNTFDALVNCRVIWTLLDPVRSLKEWMRVVKPGGKVLSFTRLTTFEEHREWREKMPQNQYPEEVSQALPLHGASVEKHLDVYRQAGFVYPSAILLERELALNPEVHKPWYAFQGIKTISEK